MTHRPSLDPERHQRTLLRVTLLLVFLVSFIVGSINVFAFQAHKIALFNFTSAFAAAVIALYYWRTRHLTPAAWALTAAVVFNLLAFIMQSKGGAYSLIWITILPPFAFFLLGRKAGAWITAAVFSFVVVYMWRVMPNLPPTSFSTPALLNVIEVLIAHFFLFLHYERSRAEAYRELEKLSLRDKLTGLYNRGKLDTELARLQGMLKRHAQPFSVILVDIDLFKQVNDEFGHLTGDRVLQQFASLLLQHRRNTDYVGRWGGEEFLILCPGSRADEAANAAERIRHAIMSSNVEQDIQLTASFGVAEGRAKETAEMLINRADQALYLAKAQGRNQVQVRQ